MMTMKKTALLCLVAFAGFASVCTAQEDAALVVEPAMDAIDASAANGTANATSTAEAEAASGSPTFPAFNYEAIYPNGIFDAAAYESWMAEVTQFYTDIYATYAGEGAQALENFYGAGYAVGTQLFNPFAYLGSFQMPSTGSFGGWYPGQGVEAVVSSLTG